MIALPFPKFFNYGQTDCSMSSCPSEDVNSFEVLEKMDGSMGAIWMGRDLELYVSTPGSMTSPQALWATQWLRNHSTYSVMRTLFRQGIIRCVVVEIIYEGSFIVVRYPEERRGLVITACQTANYDTDAYYPYGAAFAYDSYGALTILGNALNLPVCKRYYFNSLEEVFHSLTDMDNMEGYVLHWPETGHRIKLKCQDYLKAHYARTETHPNRIAEVIRNEGKGKSYEEIIALCRQWVGLLADEYNQPYSQAIDQLESVFLNLHSESNLLSPRFNLLSRGDFFHSIKNEYNNPPRVGYIMSILTRSPDLPNSQPLMSLEWDIIAKETSFMPVLNYQN